MSEQEFTNALLATMKDAFSKGIALIRYDRITNGLPANVKALFDEDVEHINNLHMQVDALEHRIKLLEDSVELLQAEQQENKRLLSEVCHDTTRVS